MTRYTNQAQSLIPWRPAVWLTVCGAGMAVVIAAMAQPATSPAGVTAPPVPGTQPAGVPRNIVEYKMNKAQQMRAATQPAGANPVDMKLQAGELRTGSAADLAELEAKARAEAIANGASQPGATPPGVTPIAPPPGTPRNPGMPPNSGMPPT